MPDLVRVPLGDPALGRFVYMRRSEAPKVRDLAKDKRRRPENDKAKKREGEKASARDDFTEIPGVGEATAGED